MKYLFRSLKYYLLSSLAASALIITALTVLSYITSTNTAICNNIEIWIETCGYVDLFLPLVVCVAFSPFFYYMNRKGFLRYAAVRMGKKKYLLTHFLATSICTILVVMISYYVPLCISMRMTPVCSVPDNRLLDYVFGEYEVYHPYIFGLVWCLYKGFVASLFVIFGNLLALYTENLFVSVIGPFIYCMAENLITALLKIPMYSIITSFVLNRLAPEVMSAYNYIIGCITYILINSLIIFIIKRKKESKCLL